MKLSPALRRLVCALSPALALLAAAGPARAQEEEKVLNVYNWSDYIAEDTIEKFTAETGIDFVLTSGLTPSTQIVEFKGGGLGLIDYDGDGVIEGENEGVKPATLDAARGGVADDLKQIKGIGPKMEKMCNALGFFHFDQIAAWTPDEEAWVNANLEGFKGRVSRDEWIAQAKLLAAGGETEFSKRVEGSNVY